MSARQRAAFILFDGKRLDAEVLSSTRGMGVSQADIQDLVEKGLLQALTASVAAPIAAPAAEPAPAVATGKTASERYLEAYRMAVRLTSNLGLRGFTLNLKVEAAQNVNDLIALLPAIRNAVGPSACRELAQALGVPDT